MHKSSAFPRDISFHTHTCKKNLVAIVSKRAFHINFILQSFAYNSINKPSVFLSIKSCSFAFCVIVSTFDLLSLKSQNQNIRLSLIRTSCTRIQFQTSCRRLKFISSCWISKKNGNKPHWATKLFARSCLIRVPCSLLDHNPLSMKAWPYLVLISYALLCICTVGFAFLPPSRSTQEG